MTGEVDDFRTRAGSEQEVQAATIDDSLKTRADSEEKSPSTRGVALKSRTGSAHGFQVETRMFDEDSLKTKESNLKVGRGIEEEEYDQKRSPGSEQGVQVDTLRFEEDAWVQTNTLSPNSGVYLLNSLSEDRGQQLSSPDTQAAAGIGSWGAGAAATSDSWGDGAAGHDTAVDDDDSCEATVEQCREQVDSFEALIPITADIHLLVRD